jgi:hypothetical protein
MSTQAEKSLRVLRSLNRRDFTTLIFKYAEYFGVTSIFDEDFLKLMASYQIRMAILKERVKDRKFVGNEFQKIEFSSSKLQTLLKLTEFLKVDVPNDIDFKNAVKCSNYNDKPTRIIVRYYEEGINGNKIINSFDLEHLMPQTGTIDFWYPMAGVIDENGVTDTIRYAAIVNNIGNLFLIDPPTNKEVKNLSFSDKKLRYKTKLKDWSIVTITDEKTEWKPSDIEERASEIAAWAKSYWTL